METENGQVFWYIECRARRKRDYWIRLKPVFCSWTAARSYAEQIERTDKNLETRTMTSRIAA